jgi:hypothetical protein
MYHTGYKVSYLEYEIAFDQFCYVIHNKHRWVNISVLFHSHFLGRLNCQNIEFLHIILIMMEVERERDWYMA